VIKDRKGEHQQVFADARRLGFVRVRVDGEIRGADEEIKLDKKRKHSIEVVVDRLLTPDTGPRDTEANERQRITESTEQALKLGGGVILVAIEGGEERLFSEHFACPFCGISLGEIEPRTFSFNSPHGACPECTGLGRKLKVDPDLVIPNKLISLSQGAIQPWARAAAVSTWYGKMLEAVAERYNISMTKPARRSGCASPTARDAATTTTPPTRVSSATWSGASAKATPTTSRQRSSATCHRCPARSARASG
jgi:excinuclease ABC subunit A